MIDLTKLQQEVYRNKVARGFNVTDVGKEIVFMVEELGELATAYKQSNRLPAAHIDNREDLVDAVGDLMVYCLGLCEMLSVDAGQVLTTIIEQNKTRTHTHVKPG